MSNQRKIVFWDCGDPEILNFDEMDVAIEDHLSVTRAGEPLPATIEVCGYARMKATVSTLDHRALEDLLDTLDEEYGGDDPTEPTGRMRAAAKRFVKAVLSEYVVWNCEVIERRTVNVAEWVHANAPHWLTEDPPVRLTEEARDQ